MMEVYPDIVEPLSYEMSINEDEYFDIDTSKTIDEVCKLIENQYTWLLNICLLYTSPSPRDDR